jgi:hypothetical protein
VIKSPTLEFSHGQITVVVLCQFAICTGTANTSVARHDPRNRTGYKHHDLADASFTSRAGQVLTLHLKFTTLGIRVLRLHEAFWLHKTHGYRMTLSTAINGRRTNHHPIWLTIGKRHISDIAPHADSAREEQAP